MTIVDLPTLQPHLLLNLQIKQLQLPLKSTKVGHDHPKAAKRNQSSSTSRQQSAMVRSTKPGCNVSAACLTNAGTCRFSLNQEYAHIRPS